jgi:hypothetical protein
MGFAPSLIDQQDWWSFLAASAGFALANGAKAETKILDLTDDDLKAMGLV